ncbi:MAG: hypothetical protein A2651_02555 [Candidatus Yanofskybacteria bacterium RIFCSPHIGHO2_01_FULL_42_12]|uniref:ASCH domain-containing protein n=1 Tax=Candidatus Yanofskybacteria bacterium RIFCSPLOWO2_01_FULL_42_49 TaxID=1802694 RepID=A0A1F8GDA0_9BACT|nr:MAG: hypothetical protein A2651_02555 [Candidatus Yanofskybacteria bacterium RIFCSPHIGHO2_01_FULL_42_12]OGN22716.1 MAG: hypothetical protein A2918_01190 [Candidatus Yanofskybacteria bacterium RIFCSPLOWO2_01_FULL_42_49]
MKTLKFKHDFVKEILAGRKITTWRLFDDKNLQVGDEIELIDANTGIAFKDAVIISVEEKKIKDLTDEELKKHEYASRDAMIESHKNYYGDKVDLTTTVKIITFKLL